MGQRRLGERQHQEERVLGDALGMDAADDGERHTFGGQRFDGQVVVADAMARDDFQSAGVDNRLAGPEAERIKSASASGRRAEKVAGATIPISSMTSRVAPAGGPCPHHRCGREETRGMDSGAPGPSDWAANLGSSVAASSGRAPSITKPAKAERTPQAVEGAPARPED